MAKKTSSTPTLSVGVARAASAGPASGLLQRTVRARKKPISAPPPHALRGTVVALNQDIGVGYVKESESGLLYGLSRKFTGVDMWRLLRENTEIEFEDNGRRVASKISLLL
jgi:hypothetical protein